MKSYKEHTLEEAIDYHLDNGLPLYENIFRFGSEMSSSLFEKFRHLQAIGQYEPHDEFERGLLETDIGKQAMYEGENVFLDYIYEEPELEQPKRGGSKKFYVYVKNEKGNVIKVEFGAKDGGQNLAVKINDPQARKNFAARHKCTEKKDKTKASYWSCRLPMYGKALGFKGGNQDFYW